MSNQVWEAMMLALTQQCANGRPLVTLPPELSASGPCPHCLHRIDPSHFTFTTEHRNDELAGIAKNGVAGIIVCARCAKPVMIHGPGQYKPIPRASLRKLPKVTRNFIERQQELILSLKNWIM